MKTLAQQLGITKFPYIVYDDNGRETYSENSDGQWTKREYDSNGNQIRFENSDGYWNKQEFDSRGNLIYWENSNGCWSKSEYDSNGNEIYWETSKGECAKYEYDSNGNEIYYENSSGKIIDNRPKNPCDINGSKNFQALAKSMGSGAPLLHNVLLWHMENGRNKYSHFECANGEAYFSIYDGEETDSIVWDLNYASLGAQSEKLIDWLVSLI